MLKFWQYPYRDIHRGLLVFLPMSINVITAKTLQLPILIVIVLNLSALLSSLALTGCNKRQQSYHLLQFAGIAIITVSIGLLSHTYLNTWLFNLSLVPVIFLLLCLQLVQKSLMMSCLFISMLLVLTIGFSNYQTLDFTQLLYSVILPMLSGFGTTFTIMLLLPCSAIALPPVPAKKAAMLRAARIAVAVSLCFILCDWFGLNHASWAAVSVLAICQGTLGATVKKAWERLLGTALGVFAGAPLGLYLFDPFPNSRYFVLIIVFVTFVIAVKHYATAIFLATLCLGAAFFVIFPESHALLPFIFDRLLETALGIFIIVTLETFISPCSVVTMMRQHTKDFWKRLTLAVGTTEKQDFREHCQQAKQALLALNNDFEEFRYEPLNLLSRRYYFARITLNALFHYHKLLLKTEADGELNDELRESLQQIYKRVACQYSLTGQPRIEFLEQIMQEFDNNYATTQPLLITKVGDIVSATLDVLKTRSVNILSR